MNAVPSSLSGNAISPKYSPGYSTFSAHSGQIVRTNRCAMNDFTTDASRNGSTSMSSNRVMPPTASFVCSVLKTRWPVIAARIAMSAVSISRISPTITTFGSCRRIWRRPRANVKSISGFTSICNTPGNLYSTGSSIVMMRRETELIVLRKQYNDVDFPQPVGPVQNDPIRLGQQTADDVFLSFTEIEALKAELLTTAGEQTQANRFAVHRRDGRNANVDLLIVRVQIHAAILRQTSFGDVHMRHHFQSRNNRGVKHAQLWRHRHFVQNSVDAVTNADVVLERLDVNIGRTLGDRFADTLINEFNDGGFGIVRVDVRRGLSFMQDFKTPIGLENFIEGFRAHAVERFHGAQ